MLTRIVLRITSQVLVGPESTVAVILDRSYSQLVAIIATLKTGAAYLPIDSAMPGARIEFMLRDSDISAVVTSRMDLRHHSTATAERLILIDDVPQDVSVAQPG